MTTETGLWHIKNQTYITFHAIVVDYTKCIVVRRVCVCLSACVSVCLSVAAYPHYCMDPDITWGSGRGCPLVVPYWADLQSVHGLRCYGNITQTRNVSEYMLVLALCLVNILDSWSLEQAGTGDGSFHLWTEHVDGRWNSMILVNIMCTIPKHLDVIQGWCGPYWNWTTIREYKKTSGDIFQASGRLHTIFTEKNEQAYKSVKIDHPEYQKVGKVLDGRDTAHSPRPLENSLLLLQNPLFLQHRPFGTCTLPDVDPTHTEGGWGLLSHPEPNWITVYINVLHRRLHHK